MMLGFDYVIGSQLAALSAFQKFFGVQQPDGSWIVPASYLSAWGAIGLGCDVVASWLAAPVLEKYGRKPLILFCAVVSTVAIILQQMATNWRIHLAGRAVNGSLFRKNSSRMLQLDLLICEISRYLHRYNVYDLAVVDWRDLSP